MQLFRRNTKEIDVERGDDYYFASQWQLVWRKYKRHKLALFATAIILLLYFVAVFADFFTIANFDQRNAKYVFAPPQALHFIDEDGVFQLIPFVYDLKQELDMDTLQRNYTEDTSKAYHLRLFVEGEAYKLLGIIDTNIHFLGVESPGVYFPFGTDEFGRDLYSRTIIASRISLSIGLIGVTISFILGCIIGGISGYFGGIVDMVIQRVIEFIISIPQIPLWIALAAALPPDWSSTQVYLGITVVLATVGWTTLARDVRGKLLELREADFVMAARISNMGDFDIIVKHLLPSFASYLIVILSLSVPGMILAETALSFLEIGIRPPSVSWGVLLQDAQNIRSLAQSPWLLIPGIFVIITVLCFQFVGDGLRDAADPYKQ